MAPTHYLRPQDEKSTSKYISIWLGSLALIFEKTLSIKDDMSMRFEGLVNEGKGFADSATQLQQKVVVDG